MTSCCPYEPSDFPLFLAVGGGGAGWCWELVSLCETSSDIGPHYGFNFGKCPLTDTELKHNSTSAKCHRGDAVHWRHGWLPSQAHFSWWLEHRDYSFQIACWIQNKMLFIICKAVKSTKLSGMCPLFSYNQIGQIFGFVASCIINWLGNNET